MLIVCPTCASEFTIAVERIGPTGRVVRCAQCRGAWFVPPQDPDPELQADIAASGAAPRHAGRVPLPPSEPHPSGGKALAILALGLACIIVFVLGLRSTVVRIVPESAAAFSLIGLPVNLVGLDLAGVTSELVAEPGGPVLVIAGDISNETTKPLAIPPLALTIEGTGGELLYNWSDRTDRGQLAPKEKRRFQARLSSPPPDGRRVIVAFSGKAAPVPVASR